MMIVDRETARDGSTGDRAAGGEGHYQVVADVWLDGGSISAVLRGAIVCSARVARRSLASPTWLHARELVIDRFSASDPKVLCEEGAGGLPVLRDLLRRAILEPTWRSHLVTVVADCADSAVVGAAWRLAAEMEWRCEVGWAGPRQLAVSIYGPGLRSGLAHALSHGSLLSVPSIAIGRMRDRRPRSRQATAAGGLYSRDLRATVAPPAEVEGLAFREASLADVSRRPLLYADSVQGAEEPLTRGEVCVVGEIDDRIVFRMWVGDVRAEWSCEIAPSLRGLPSWYVHDCRTEPDARRRGIYLAALHWLAERAKGRGVGAIHLHVAADNVPAIGAVERAGFRRAAAESNLPIAPRGALVTQPMPGVDTDRGLSLSRPGVLELVREVVGVGSGIRVRAAGTSMWPTVPDGAVVELGGMPRRLRRGQIVLLDWKGTAVLHRLVAVRRQEVETCGDACIDRDPPTPREHVVAVARSVEVGGDVVPLIPSLDWGVVAWMRFVRARGRLAAARVWRAIRRSER